MPRNLLPTALFDVNSRGELPPDMVRKVVLNYVYMDLVTQERFDRAGEELGWGTVNLIRQTVQAFLKVNNNYYVEAALADCQARGMAQKDHFQLLRDQGEEGLQPYLSERPAFGTSPLASVPAVLTREDYRRRCSNLTLGDYSAVLLGVVRIVDQTSLAQVLSKIIWQHFQKYWESNYANQLELAELCLYRKEV